MITPYCLLEYAIGDIRKGVMSPIQSVEGALRYHSITPSCGSILSLMDVCMDLPSTSRHRFVDIPFGHSFDTTIGHISTCGNSAYKRIITYESISINDWFRHNGHTLDVYSGLHEMRKALIEHILKDNIDPLLDEYICAYYLIVITSLIRTLK